MQGLSDEKRQKIEIAYMLSREAGKPFDLDDFNLTKTERNQMEWHLQELMRYLQKNDEVEYHATQLDDE